jgi:hypothetical protein
LVLVVFLVFGATPLEGIKSFFREAYIGFGWAGSSFHTKALGRGSRRK